MLEDATVLYALFFLYFCICNFYFLFCNGKLSFYLVKSKLFLNKLCRKYNCKVAVHRPDKFVLKSYVKTAMYRYMCYVLFAIHKGSSMLIVYMFKAAYSVTLNMFRKKIFSF